MDRSLRARKHSSLPQREGECLEGLDKELDEEGLVEAPPFDSPLDLLLNEPLLNRNRQCSKVLIRKKLPFYIVSNLKNQEEVDVASAVHDEYGERADDDQGYQKKARRPSQVSPKRQSRLITLNE